MFSKNITVKTERNLISKKVIEFSLANLASLTPSKNSFQVHNLLRSIEGKDK